MKAEEDEKEDTKAVDPPPAPEGDPDVASQDALPSQNVSASDGPVSAVGSAECPVMILHCQDECFQVLTQAICDIFSRLQLGVQGKTEEEAREVLDEPTNKRAKPEPGMHSKEGCKPDITTAGVLAAGDTAAGDQVKEEVSV